jgi:predicted metal-binding membrane protein
MTPPALDRVIETALRRDRAILVVSLCALAAIAWLYLWREADIMDRMMAGELPMAMQPTAASAVTLLLAFLMWAVMMVGMMLPSAAPMILFYAAMVRRNSERGTQLPAAWIFTAGYLLVWTAFSMAATGLQVLFEALSVASSMMEVSSRWLAGGLLVVAGIWQWSPLKEACLAKCRSPLHFIAGHWHTGRTGALRMGTIHGLYCLGCCWALMLLLFVGGVMNLLWVALISAFVLVEKLTPPGRLVGRVAGVGFAVAGMYLLVWN